MRDLSCIELELVSGGLDGNAILTSATAGGWGGLVTGGLGGAVAGGPPGAVVGAAVGALGGMAAGAIKGLFDQL